MTYRENIWAGPTDLASVVTHEGADGYEVAMVCDQNECNRAENEDVVAIASANGALLVHVSDGISADRREGRKASGFQSAEVAKRFAQIALEEAKAALTSQRPLNLNTLHRVASLRLKQDCLQGRVSLGGIMGVTALFLPDGSTQINRFGDPQPALSNGRLWVPPSLYPENVGLEEYLKWCSETGTEPDLDRDHQLWRGRVLTPKREDGVATSYITSSPGEDPIQFDTDFQTMLRPGNSALLATDGLSVYRNWGYIEGLDWTGKVEDLLHAIHLKALYTTADNLSGVLVRRALN